jgi:hypothetical protein
MGCQHGWVMRRNLVVVGALVAVLASCSSGDGGGAAGTTGAGSPACEVGSWVSSSIDAPAQAGIGDVAPVGGGDGIAIEIGADGVFQVDFGPMKPATGSFQSGGQTATLATTFSGVGKGTWKSDGTDVSATFDDFTTVRTMVTITLGDTVPPVFDETLQQLNDDRMLGGQQAGVFSITDCATDSLTLTTPYPNGSVVVHAVRAGG